MIAFNKMWNDVCSMLSEKNIENLSIVENFKNGFVVRNNENTEIVTKDDFIDVWCKMLYYNEISEHQINAEKKVKQKYVYDIIKQLPYIAENYGILKIAE